VVFPGVAITCITFKKAGFHCIHIQYYIQAQIQQTLTRQALSSNWHAIGTE